MKRLLASACLILAAGGMAMTTALPASAAASQKARPAAAVGAAVHRASAAGAIAATGILSIREGSGGDVNISCNPGTNHDVFGSPTMLTADNGCSVRVWFHQFTNYGNNHGWAYCISPRTFVAIPTQFDSPKNIFISTSTAPCA